MATLPLHSVTAVKVSERNVTRTIVSSTRPILSSASSLVGNSVARRANVKSLSFPAPQSLLGERHALSAIVAPSAVARFSGLRGLPASKSGKRTKWQQYTEGPAKEARLRVVQMALSEIPEGRQGLYDPSMDKDACGVGFIAELSAVPTRQTVRMSFICLEA
jgi:hypothetical protein